MKLETVGDLIAIRKLQFLGKPTSEVVVTLGSHSRLRTSWMQKYDCLFQITGAGDECVRYAAGIDAFHAIELTLKLIGSVLSRLSRDLNGQLHWEYDEKGGFGFPEFRES
jgi:hypothetical protein